MFLNGQAIPSPGPHGEQIERRLVRAAVQRPRRGPRVQAAAPAHGRALGARALHRRTRAAAPGSVVATAPRSSINVIAHSITILRAGDLKVSGAVTLRATYRLQLTPDFGFAAAGRGSPTCATSASRTCTCRRRCRRGPAPRTATTSSTRRGSRTISAARPRSARWPPPPTPPGWGSCSTSCPTTWPPTTPTASGPTRELRERFFDIDPATGRHRRFFDIDDLAGVRQEDPEVFEETHALVLSLVREGLVDALRIDHPDGLADPASYLARLRDGRRRRRSGSRRSSSRPSSCATGR